MSKSLNGTLASFLVAAAAFGANDAAAQSRADILRDRAHGTSQSAETKRQLLNTCYTVGANKGVSELPLTRKAFQQDRDLGVGCTFTKAAGGEFIVLNAHDLGTGGAAYAKEIENLQKREDSEAKRFARQNPNRDETGNVIRDGAKETRETVNDARKTVDEVNRTMRSVDQATKALKRFGF